MTFRERKFLILMKSNSLPFSLMDHAFRFIGLKNFSNTKLQRFSQIFCYYNLIVSGSTFISVSHFRLDLYMMQGTAQGCCSSSSSFSSSSPPHPPSAPASPSPSPPLPSFSFGSFLFISVIIHYAQVQFFFYVAPYTHSKSPSMDRENC